MKRLKHYIGVINRFKFAIITYLLWQYKKMPNGSRVKLDASQKRAIDAIWKQFRFINNYKWHELIYSAGSNSPEIVPCDVFYYKILPKLNNRKMSFAWEDKCYAPLIFAGLPLANSVLYCIDNKFFDKNYNIVDAETALSILQSKCGKVLVKPSTGSGTGIGVQIFDPTGIAMPDLLNMVKGLRGNCIFQDLIKQSLQFQQLNSSSVNIIRINSLRLGTKIYTLNSTIRFGVPGKFTDVSFDRQGNEIINFLGINDDGIIQDKVIHYDGKAEPIQNFGIKEKMHIDGYEEAIELSKLAHARLQHFDFVGFDITIGWDNHPILIEANIGSPGILGYQYVHGPLFREHLQEVLEHCSRN